MTTNFVLEELARNPSASFVNEKNPHWAIGRMDFGYWVDYWCCDDPDCDCYQHYENITRAEILERFPNDKWIKQI